MNKKIFAYNVFFILLSLSIIFLFRYTDEKSNMDFSEFVQLNKGNASYFRSPVGLEFSSRPIILIGDSFTYGSYLKEEDTFSYQLSKYTKRPVYNYAIPGHCIQHMLFLLRSQNFNKNLNKPEYIIYTYIPAHLNRLNNTNYWGCTSYLEYKTQNNHLVEYNFPFKIWNTTYLYNFIQQIKYDMLIDRAQFKRLNLLKLYFEETRLEIQKYYPDIKFVILLYDYSYIDINKMWKDLKNEGFIVLKVSEISNIDVASEEYKLPKDIDKYQHPNKLVWEKIIPKLYKYLF